MNPPLSKPHRTLELPEVISGVLALLVVLWEVFVARFASVETERHLFMEGSQLLLCAVVWFNTLAVAIHFGAELKRHNRPTRFLWMQLLTGLSASALFSGALIGYIPYGALQTGMVLSFFIGIYAIINIRALRKERRRIGKRATHSRWSPSVVFFTAMLTMVMVSTLILLTPGACIKPISFTDAFFTCASAISITGLTTVDVGSTFTPLGKLVVLVNIQVGAIGVMTFSYFVLLLVGKKLAVRDRLAISSLLDQQGVNIIPALIKTVIFITFSVEIVGACLIYLLWKGTPGVPQDLLWFRAIFHAISAFCNAGIALFPNNMAEECVRDAKLVQAVMMMLTLAGTLGFGVYLECYTRLKNKLTGKRNPVRWSTHTWLVVRATGFVMLLGTLGLFLLSILEPSQHATSGDWNIWESVWNTIGRSAGFNVSDISTYGPVYQIFLCALMFVGGNPAGTGGGVYAPLFIICILEVIRVLRGQHDLELHKRRIARNTVERAMATVVISTFWIVSCTMLLMLFEPAVANSANGTIKLLFLEVSAFTTTGYSLINPGDLSATSKFFICANMLFGRVGMFTFMLIFIKQKEPSPIRYPETRLPLS